ncbi:MAG: hypothetical protein J7578_22030 [Chitinophagaceae bacterium]|nr:hypothetical protein [Chitinophagaceae bacterium]
MIRYPYLIPECNVDTAFVEMLGYDSPNHAPNIQQVCIALDNSKANTVCIGFIDDDKKKPAYISNFTLMERSDNFHILKHKTKKQFLVVAIPAMDKVIYRLCQDLNIDPSRYGFPNDFQAFLSKTKKQAIRNDKSFKNLLNTIKQKKHPDIEIIKSLVSKYY